MSAPTTTTARLEPGTARLKPGKLIGFGVAGIVAALIGVYAGPLAALLFLLFIAGAPLFTVMIGFAALGCLNLPRSFDNEFGGAFQDIMSLAEKHSHTMSTIPLFIYAGYLLAESRTADRLVRFANAVLGWVPGGLAIVTILTCALFTVFTGASGVTIIALGGVLMPSLVKNGYPERFSMGLIAGTGSVGLLFPPALPLFIYGAVYGLTTVNDPVEAAAWADRKFLFAGIVPGMVLIAMISAVAVFVAVRRKLPRHRFDAKELAISFVKAAPELLIPFGVIAALASGIGLPEVAALTVLYVLVLEVFILRMITVRTLWSTSREALAMVGAILMIIVGSMVLTNYMVTADVPKTLVNWTKSTVESKIVFLLVLNLLLLLVGTVMDIFSAIVVVVPLIAPIAKAYGIDPCHLGVIFLLNLEVGYLSPPVGLNLFLTSVKFNRPITEVMWATVPFLITMIVALFTITYIPAITVAPEQAIARATSERREPVNNLVEIVKLGVLEAKVAFKEIALVDVTGTPLKDGEGQPIVRKYLDCEKLPVLEKGPCQDLFNDVTTCRPSPKASAPAQMACANRAIAEWTVGYMNSDARPELSIIQVDEVRFVDLAGKPLEREVPVLDAKGQPVTDADGAETTESKPFLTKAGGPIAKQLDQCKNLTGFERDTCRSLFVTASNCKIAPPDPADCIAGGKDAPTCLAESIAECIATNVASWADENPDKVIE